MINDKTICILAFSILFIVLTANAAEWKIGKADKCLRFALTEERGIPRRNEPVLISGADILRKFKSRRLLIPNFRLFGPQGEIALQIDKCDQYKRYISNDRQTLSKYDELVFLATIPADSQSVYQLYYEKGKKAPTTATKGEKTQATDLKATFTSLATKGYDLLLENSRFQIGIRAKGERNSKDKPRKNCQSEGSIVMLKTGKHDFSKVKLPYTNFQQRSDVAWNGLEIIADGPVRTIAVACLNLNGTYRHRDGTWSISWNDNAKIDGVMHRAFTIYSNSSIIDIDDCFVAETVGGNFTMNYFFSFIPPTAKGSDWQLTRNYIYPDSNGFKTVKYDRKKNARYNLNAPQRDHGWLAVRDESTGLGLEIAYNPATAYQAYLGNYGLWAAKPFNSARLVPNIIIGTYNRDVLRKNAGHNKFRLWVMTKDSSPGVALLKQSQFEYALSKTITYAPIWKKGKKTNVISPDNSARGKVLTGLEEQLKKMEHLYNVKYFRHHLPPTSKAAMSQFRKTFDVLKKVNATTPVARRYIMDNAKKLQYEMNAFKNSFAWSKLALYEDNKQFRTCGFTAYTTGAIRKIRPESPIPSTLPQTVSLDLARNESESFQIVLLTRRRLNLTSVKISDLIGPGNAVIKADTAIRRFRVGYVSPVKNGKPTNENFQPDPLIPLSGCPGFPALDKMLFQPEIDQLTVLSPERNNPFWFTVKAPGDTPSGTYTGTIAFSAANKQSLKIPVQIKIFKFTIPKEPSLVGDIWFNNGNGFYRYYKRTYPKHDEYARMTKEMAQYRVSTQLAWNPLTPLVKVAIEKDGRYSFDFSKLDPWIETNLKYSKWFNVNLGGGTGWTGHFGGVFGRRTPILDKRTGKIIKFPKKSISQMDMIKQPIFTQFWKAYLDHLRERGWLKYGYLENIDEPPYGPGRKDKPRNKFLRAFHSAIKKIAPDLILMNYGMNPAKKYHGWAEKYVDAWGPGLSSLEDTKNDLKKQVKKGKPFMTYVCGSPKTTLDTHTPDVAISQPGIDLRIIPWMVYKYGAMGILYYSGNGWVGDRSTHYVEKVPEKRWPAKPWNLEDCGFGVGRFTYPAPKAKYIFPTVRLENIRDGLEDYEYLHLLQKKLKSCRDAKKVEKYKNLLTFDALVKNVFIWSEDPRKLRAMRLKIALAIEDLDAVGK